MLETRRKHEILNKIKFKFYLKNSSKIQTTFHQYQNLYMVHVPAKFRENTSIRFLSYSAKTKPDGRTDGRTDVWYAVGLCIVGLILKYAVGLLKVFSRT